MSNKLERAREILELESRAIQNIPLDNRLLEAVDLLVATRGKVVCCGMGKAGIIARKVAATFSSTGTPAVFLHPGEAQHGDLGLLSPGDVLLVFSNSGKTREAIELVQLARQLIPEALPVITITSDADSALARASQVALTMGRVQEACSLGMAPTASTTAMLALGDVLCMLVMEEKNFTPDDFFKRHHGGYLGQQKPLL
ncbi:MAG: SIS domain-containing protein [Bacteroidetes bacterium]|nr:SIS domain-containing protein [Bacteroidota bacterium]MBK8657702.1 SIS domain-containing protein [Bacteroidota bacterium]